MILPLLALKLLFTKPKLLGLCLAPGVFTFAVSALIVWLSWHLWLTNIAFWLAAPTSLLIFLIAWLLVGNLSLIPVEDSIIDICQQTTLGKVIYPAPKFHVGGFTREIFYSAILTLFALILFLLSFFPLFTLLSIAIAALLTAFNFLRSLLARITNNKAKQLAIFFSAGFSYLLLGLFLNFLLFIPLVNVFLLGYAQILSTLVFLRNQGQQINTSRK